MIFLLLSLFCFLTICAFGAMGVWIFMLSEDLVLLREKLDTVSANVDAEVVEIKAIVDASKAEVESLKVEVEALKARVAELENVSLAEELAKVDALAAKVTSMSDSL